MVADSEVWITLLESWLAPSLAALNRHHSHIHPGVSVCFFFPPISLLSWL
jgi:hypothetical protein